MALSRRLLLLLGLLAHVDRTTGTLYRFFCHLEDEKVVNAYMDGESFYVPVAAEDPKNETNVRRHATEEWTSWNALRGNSNEIEYKSSSSAIMAMERFVQDTTADASEAVPVRRCHCAFGKQYEGSEYYCVLPYTHCAIPSSNWNADLTPGCLNATRSNKTAKSMWYPILVMYAMLLCCMFCTVSGRNAPHFVASKFIPGWNRRLADRVLEGDRKRTSILIRRYCQRRRREMERLTRREARENTTGAGSSDPDARGEANGFQDLEEIAEPQVPPTSLALKTRIYDASKETKVAEHVSDHESDLGDEATCSICFGPLVDGCRVGALPCEHVFHVECLKTWLKRRNVCPLCQAANVATPRYEDKPVVEDSSNSGTEEEGGSERRDATSLLSESAA